MKTTKLLGVSLVLFSLLLSCSKEEPKEAEAIPKDGIVNQTGCKYFTTALPKIINGSDTSCVIYSYDPLTKMLSIQHTNAGFNCCPGVLYVQVDKSQDVITIKEFENSADCFCECLYDLDIEIYNVESKGYYIIFEEPYLGGQNAIAFFANLQNNPNGSYCVYRDQYPWDH